MSRRLRSSAEVVALFAGLVGVVFSTSEVLAESTQPAIAELRCEYLVNPMGIDQKQPRLSWRIESASRGVYQAAYQILVASTQELLNGNQADLWDSQRVASGETSGIVYQGRPLGSRARCFWKVRIWGRSAGQPYEAESGTACWTMGLLESSDWQAQYISYRDQTPVFKDRESLFLPPARQYRKSFQSDHGEIKRATVYATALGIYELYLNGTRVSDHFFAPGWTDYRLRAYYKTYDVTDLVRGGENVVGAWVADGWYSGYVGFGLLTGMGTEKIGRYTYGKTPSVMAQVEIEYTDGTRTVVGTDKTWKVTGNGPIQQADFLMGEFYDARQELAGWCQPGFDDHQWDQAILASENGHPKATFYEARNPTAMVKNVRIEGREMDLGFVQPKLEAFPGVPVRVTQTISPIEVTKLAVGKYIYNLGQNIAGTVRLRVHGEAGQRITLRYGEMLYPDGRLMTENLRKARATDTYILKGDPEGEDYIPRFTFHGFQYVEVTFEPGTGNETAVIRPTVEGFVLHSDTPLASTFECLDPMANRLFKNVVWTQRANFIDLPTDCPQRDERMGWTGDAQVYVATATYNADVAAFYTKWLRELMESQRPSGAFPGYAPFPFQHGWDFGTAWADAGVICPWTIWQAYGDTRVIQECWEPMTRFMQWRKRTSRQSLGVNHGNDWGDWLTQDAVKTPLEYVDTIYFAITSRLMAQMAQATARHDEAARYDRQFENIKAAFIKKYVRDDGSLTVNKQTAYALALYADLIPVEMRQATGQKLADLICANGTRMSTGFLGTRPILPVLSSVGQHDLAVFLFQSRAFPSWGYEVEQGATTIWERWDSYTKEDGFGRHNAAMNSFAHYAFGAVCEWMFRSLAGIESDGPGYRKLIIRPLPPAPGSNAERQPIDWVRASYDAITGRIKCQWRVTDVDFELGVTIPANTTATVFLPASDVANVTETGKSIAAAEGVKFLRMEDGAAVMEVESGSYLFTSPNAVNRSKVAYKTFLPPDNSTNPEGLDVTDARTVIRWDFEKADGASAWSKLNHLKFERRDGKTFVVGTGDDPQMETLLDQPVSGMLAVQVVAQATKGTTAQFFWAAGESGFRADMSNSRALNAASELKEYLFRIGDGKPLQKIRLDPFSNQSEMRIQSITLFQLAN